MESGHLVLDRRLRGPRRGARRASRRRPRRDLGRAAGRRWSRGGGGLGCWLVNWNEARRRRRSAALLGGSARRRLVAGRCARGGTRAGTALLVGAAALVFGALALIPVVGYLEAVALPALALRAAPTRRRAVRRPPHRLPSELRRCPDRHRRPDAVDVRGRCRATSAPTLAALAERATYRRAVTVVPLADARLPDVDRDRRVPGRAPDPAPRLVPPRGAAASSSTARRSARCARAGTRRSIRDTIVGMNQRPPLEGRGDAVRGGRGRRPRRRGGQHHLLPRPHAAPADACPA